MFFSCAGCDWMRQDGSDHTWLPHRHKKLKKLPHNSHNTCKRPQSTRHGDCPAALHGALTWADIPCGSWRGCWEYGQIRGIHKWKIGGFNQLSKNLPLFRRSHMTYGFIWNEKWNLKLGCLWHVSCTVFKRQIKFKDFKVRFGMIPSAVCEKNTEFPVSKPAMNPSRKDHFPAPGDVIESDSGTIQTTGRYLQWPFNGRPCQTSSINGYSWVFQDPMDMNGFSL